MNNAELINVTVYEPHNALFGNKNDKAEASYFYCEKSTCCDYLESNTCMNVGAMGRPCPYGTRRVAHGFTRRARKYRSWISGHKDKNKDMLYKLNGAPKRIAEVGDEFVLPYPFMTMNEKVPFKVKGGGFSDGQPFILKSELTSEMIKEICSYRPQAMMGGEIKDYQDKSVPKFLKDLSDYYPEIYSSAINLTPELASRVDGYSYIGREAIVSTLKPGCVVKEKRCSWVWDGEYLISDNYDMLFAITKYDEIFVKVKPKAGQSIKVTSNDQICETTEFSD